MNTLQRLRQFNMGIVENRTHTTTRKAEKGHLLNPSETCFNGYSKLTMKQLQEMSNNRHKNI